MYKCCICLIFILILQSISLSQFEFGTQRMTRKENETETAEEKKFARRLFLTHEPLKYGACNSIKFQ